MEEGAEKELEKRSKFLKSLIQNKKIIQQQEQQQHFNNNVKVRACDMPLTLQNHAFRCAFDLLDSMPSKNRDTKRLALTLKKEFDSTYGPAWHCIVAYNGWRVELDKSPSHYPFVYDTTFIYARRGEGVLRTFFACYPFFTKHSAYWG